MTVVRPAEARLGGYCQRRPIRPVRPSVDRATAGDGTNPAPDRTRVHRAGPARGAAATPVTIPLHPHVNLVPSSFREEVAARREQRCYDSGNAAFIEFRPNPRTRQGFALAQLLHYTLEPDPELQVDSPGPKER